MGIWELFVLAVGLSMDAFAVSVCKGLAVKKADWKGLLLVGLWFGGFQMLMPCIGYVLGVYCKEFVTAVSHWIAFVLLLYVGVNMIIESFRNTVDERDTASLGFVTMFFLAVATSIDALAVGITFAFLDVSLPFALPVIGGTTFTLSGIGFLIGKGLGKHLMEKAKWLGGAILILLGVKILLEGLGVL